MNTIILKAIDDYDCLVSLHARVRDVGLRFALPPDGVTDVICLSPADTKATENRLVCLWTEGGKAVHKPPCPGGTKICAEPFSDRLAEARGVFSLFDRVVVEM